MAVWPPLRSSPSRSRLALAPSITPEATALADPSRRPGAAAFEQEGQGAETGRECGRERREEDGGSGHGALLGARRARRTPSTRATATSSSAVSRRSTPSARRCCSRYAAGNVPAAALSARSAAPKARCQLPGKSLEVARFGRAPGGPMRGASGARTACALIETDAAGRSSRWHRCRSRSQARPSTDAARLRTESAHLAATRASSAVGTIRV